MNGKQIACIVLLMIIGVITYAGQMVHKKASSALKDAKSAENAAREAESARQIAENLTKRIEFESTELRRFLTAWTGPIDKMQTNQEVEEAIQSSIRSSNVYVDSQKLEPKTSSAGKVIPKVVRASIVAEDDYVKTMNWLGDLEKRIPLARISACRIVPGKEPKSIRMELSLEIPIVNLKADPIDPKKKV